MAIGGAQASVGGCPGVDGRDPEALARCIIEQLCIKGIYDPPRSVRLSADAVTAYRALDLDAVAVHYRLDVTLRKRAGAAVGQCSYQGPNRFMFSLVEPVSDTEIEVRFDPDWVY